MFVLIWDLVRGSLCQRQGLIDLIELEALYAQQSKMSVIQSAIASLALIIRLKNIWVKLWSTQSIKYNSNEKIKMEEIQIKDCLFQKLIISNTLILKVLIARIIIYCVISIVKPKTMSDSLEKINTINQLKSLDEIINEISQKNDINQSVLELCKNDLNLVYEHFKSSDNMSEEEILSWVTSQQEKFKIMKDYPTDQSDEFLVELFAILMKGAEIAFEGKVPRYHQMICLWLNVHSSKTILEVKTGEGKTMIAALTALYFALRGKKVDIFTSSAALAMTETQPDSSVSKLFALFKISLGDVCLDRTVNPHLAYQNQVIYGTSFEFQADYLQKVFTGDLRYFKERNFDQNHVAILDEVDALLIDRMRDTTRLSSEKPLFECIKAILILINEVKIKLRLAKEQFCGALQVKILGEVIKFDKKVNQSNNFEDFKQYIKEQKQQVLQIVKAAVQTKIRYMIPNYLLVGSDSYINIMLPLWIDSSYQIRNYVEDVHYIVSKEMHQITPIDISTGTYQKTTKWMNGVHQFIELKYGFEPSVDSIVTNYESNLIFFRRYRHYLYGMTGTICESLGKSENAPSIFERFLTENYQVKIYKIPTAKKRLLSFESPKLYADRSQWMEALYRDSKKYSEKRMVLIIFNTIKEAKDFVNNFPQKQEYRLLELYDHDEYHKSLQQKLDVQKTIIVSTNLGGRGTDIEISNQSILDNGGLYVMMTYFAPNWRIEEQAFGRAGRNGQPGSGSFYLNISKPLVKGKKLEQDQQLCQELFQKMAGHRKYYQQIEFESSKMAIKNLQLKSQLLDKFYNAYLKQAHEKIQKLNEIIDSHQRYIQNCWPQFIQYYETKMECNFAQEQWGIFLKRKSFDRNKGKEAELAIDFNEFVRQYGRNRRSNDVNPGYFAICGSQLLEISPQRSEALIDMALTKNDKSWVTKYYKVYFRLKKHSDSQIQGNVANSLIAELKQVCQIILVQFSLEMAISANTNLPEKKKKQLNNLKLFYIDVMSNLQTIGESLQKYVINDKKRMKMSCKMKRNEKNITSLRAKGLNHLIKGFQMQEINQDKNKKKKGFFAAICSAVKSVVMTVASVITTAAAVLATPFIAVCGNFGSVWQGVGKLWKKTGESWKDTIDRLPNIAIVGLSLLAIYFTNGVAIPAVAALIRWLYLRSGETITTSSSVPLQKGSASEALPLVQINGTYRLSLQAQKKIDLLRAKYEEKQKDINKFYETIYDDLEKWNRSSNMSGKKIKQIEQIAFSKNKQSQLPNAFKQQNEQTMKKILNKTKAFEKVNNEISIINQTKKSVQETIDQAGGQILQKVMRQFKKNSQRQLQKINKEINQITAFRFQIDNYSSKLKLAQPQLQKLGTKVIEHINKNKTLSKVADISNPLEIANQIIIPFVDRAFLQAEINKINEPIRELVNLNQQINQIQQIFRPQRILNNPFYIQNRQIKNRQIREITKELQKQYASALKQKIEAKQEVEMEQNQQEYEKKLEQIELETLEKIQQNCERLRVSPIVDTNQINEPQFYEETAYWKCKSQSVTFFRVESQNEFIETLKQNKGKQVVILFQKAVIYQTPQLTLLKIYEQRNQSNASLIKATERSKLLNRLVFADKDGCLKCGNVIISDLNKFIYEKLIDEKSEIIIAHNVKKEYLKSLILKEIVNHFSEQKYEAIRKQRERQKPSLPAYFMPFQMTKQQIQMFGYEISDIICRATLKTEDAFKRYKQLVQSVRRDLARQQEEEIRQKYTEIYDLLRQQQSKKPARR